MGSFQTFLRSTPALPSPIPSPLWGTLTDVCLTIRHLSILYSSNKPPLYLNLLTKLRLLVNACSSFRFIFLINCKRLCHHNIKSRKILKNKGNQIIKLNLFQTEIILFLLPYCSLDVTTWWVHSNFPSWFLNTNICQKQEKLLPKSTPLKLKLLSSLVKQLSPQSKQTFFFISMKKLEFKRMPCHQEYCKQEYYHKFRQITWHKVLLLGTKSTTNCWKSKLEEKYTSTLAISYI